MSRFRFFVVGVGLCLFSESCGHTQAATATAQPSEPKPQETPAARERANLPRTDGSASSDELNMLMKEHFVIALWARNAVIDGSLEPIREPLRALSDYGYETVPLAWMGGIARMQAAARIAANAETIEAAASGIAALASACGRCHLDQDQVVPVEKYAVDTEAAPADEFALRMSRHAWAVERLWDGLVAPSDAAWREGAAALVHAPMQAPKPKNPAPRDFAGDFNALRDLGVRGQGATALEMRVDIYAKILTTCSRCHADVDEHAQVRAQRVPEPSQQPAALTVSDVGSR